MNCSVSGCTRAAWHKKNTCFQHTVPPRKTLYRVWQAVRETPHASLREIGYQLHIAPSTVNRALFELDRIGAVRKPEYKVARGLVVLPVITAPDQDDDGVKRLHSYRVLWIDA